MQYGETLKKVVDENEDYEIISLIGDFNKLIAREARYDKLCHSRYIVDKSAPKENAHDIALSLN